MATIFDRDKDGARTENANGEFGFPSNAHELQKSSSTSTSILTLSISGGPAERKVSSSSIGGNSYGSNPANTTALTILDETVSTLSKLYRGIKYIYSFGKNIQQTY